MEMTPKLAKHIGDKLGIKWGKITPRAIIKGAKVEFEHTDIFPEKGKTAKNWEFASKIAHAHLKETPVYYDKLEQIEGEGDSENEEGLLEMDTYEKHKKELPDDLLEEHIYVEELGDIEPHVCVYRVDGEWIRNNLDIDFTTGANPGRYMFTPEDELWVEENLNKEDACASTLHEYVESKLMKNDGMDYDHAHFVANTFELEMRDQFVNKELKIKSFEEIPQVVKDFMKEEG